MTNQDNERWRPFKEEHLERGHYQIELIYRERCKPFRMYAYFNGKNWHDDRNRQLDINWYQEFFHPWCEDYEE